MRFSGSHGVVACSAIVLLACAVTAVAQTPTLGEIAQKEQERRKAAKQPAKVYTNDDLKNGGLPSAPPPADARSATDAAHGSPTESAPAPDAQKDGKAAPAGAAKKEADATDAKDETAWRGRISEARDDLRRNEVFAEALQSRINALTTDFAARDNPIQRSQIADERQKALAELDRVKKAREEQEEDRRSRRGSAQGRRSSGLAAVSAVSLSSFAAQSSSSKTRTRCGRCCATRSRRRATPSSKRATSRRPCSAPAGAAGPGRAVRPAAARGRRLRRPARGQGARSRDAGHRDDRLRQHPGRGRGDEGRRARLPRQAGRSRSSAADGRARARAAAAGHRKHAAARRSWRSGAARRRSSAKIAS